MRFLLIKFPLIFLTYLVVLLYFCIFTYNLPLLILFICSILLALSRKYYLMIPIVIVFAVFFLLINSLSIRDNENQPKALSKIELIPDTIQVNGDLLSF